LGIGKAHGQQTAERERDDARCRAQRKSRDEPGFFDARRFTATPSAR
jgi:hypothetical protein